MQAHFLRGSNCTRMSDQPPRSRSRKHVVSLAWCPSGRTDTTLMWTFTPRNKRSVPPASHVFLKISETAPVILRDCYGNGSEARLAQ